MKNFDLRAVCCAVAVLAVLVGSVVVLGGWGLFLDCALLAGILNA